MTLKDMIEKIENYNEIARVTRQNQMELTIGEYHFQERFSNAEEMVKRINDTYIDEAAKAILEYPYFEFEREHKIPWIDFFGNKNEMLITCDIIAM